MEDKIPDPKCRHLVHRRFRN